MTPIVLFHPSLHIQKDGGVASDADIEDVDILKQLCNENNIILLDMTDAFMKAFENEKILPHGFSNTEAGKGHLNDNGHLMIAQALASLINQRSGISQ